ncbi:hypothetical protein AXF42_Ash013642 [Apostasia shenzhenica]|uniref:Uncharacterized protein n=1 Tax=Apostasia shenzhenica TaxID=1088818 RepID=A0A2I0APK3_9ASPA|nr:hypothetical protein AXF42_Ash013642 [Apostasia shenzhenica]
MGGGAIVLGVRGDRRENIRSAGGHDGDEETGLCGWRGAYDVEADPSGPDLPVRMVRGERTNARGSRFWGGEADTDGRESGEVFSSTAGGLTDPETGKLFERRKGLWSRRAVCVGCVRRRVLEGVDEAGLVSVGRRIVMEYREGEWVGKGRCGAGGDEGKRQRGGSDGRRRRSEDFRDGGSRR